MSVDNNKRFQRKYSEQFKRLVVEEYLQGELSISELMKKYGILGSSCITYWRRQYGYSDPRISFEKSTFLQMSKQGKKPKSKKLSEDKKALKRLQQKNSDLELQLEIYRRIIQKAEEQFDIKIEKKLDTK
jgi:transposase-like protein